MFIWSLAATSREQYRRAIVLIVPNPSQQEAQVDIKSIISELDSEIARLQQAHILLSRIAAATTAKKAAAPTQKDIRRRPKLSKAARARIAAAQRKRWAAVRKAAKTTPVRQRRKSHHQPRNGE
jgi:hypothetical protein